MYSMNPSSILEEPSMGMPEKEDPEQLVPDKKEVSSEKFRKGT